MSALANPQALGWLAPMLSPLQRDIMAVITGSPQNTKRLARLAGRPSGSHFRQALANLSRAGLVVRTPDGWRRAVTGRRGADTTAAVALLRQAIQLLEGGQP